MRRTPAAHLRMASTSLAAFAAVSWARPNACESLLLDEPRIGEGPGGEPAPRQSDVTAYALAAAARRLEALQSELLGFRAALAAVTPSATPKPGSFVAFSMDEVTDEGPSPISPLIDFYRNKALAAERDERMRRGFGEPAERFQRQANFL